MQSRIGAAADAGADQRDPLQLPVGFPVELFRGAARRRRGAALPEGSHGATVTRLPYRRERRHPRGGAHGRRPDARTCCRRGTGRTSRSGGVSRNTACCSGGATVDRDRAERPDRSCNEQEDTARAAAQPRSRLSSACRPAGAGARGATDLARTDPAIAAGPAADDRARLQSRNADRVRHGAGRRRPHRRLSRRARRRALARMPRRDPIGEMTNPDSGQFL